MSRNGCLLVILIALASCVLQVTAGLARRQHPAPASNVKTVTSPNGYKIRYKEPGNDGICETTPNVRSYSGYIDLNDKSHTFFWFFEARNNPETAPTTLWLNGGPGSDSLIGLFQEIGPCSVSSDMKTVLNEHSWTNHSNVLFISQPLGTGFSYSNEELGYVDPMTGSFVATQPGKLHAGRFPDTRDVSGTTTAQQAALVSWEVVQAFYDMLPKLDSRIQNRAFHLWTESFGGHYGPSFFRHFNHMNGLIRANKVKGVPLTMESLGIGNGLIDLYIQARSFPDFANSNSYGVKTVNETIHNYMKFALHMQNGCLDLILACRYTDHSTPAGRTICVEASHMCRGNVEGPYAYYSGRSSYDIRKPAGDQTIPDHYISFLNLPTVQDALGVDLNYSANTGDDVFDAFKLSGDYAYRTYMGDLQSLLSNGVRVHLYYGDADYLCNWHGGEAVSLLVEYSHAAEFRSAGYERFMVDGKEHGVVRQRGNFSFARIYDAGHKVPFYQPKASQEMFRRVIAGLDVATGKETVSGTYRTDPKERIATHTQPHPAWPVRTAFASGMYKSSQKLDGASGSSSTKDGHSRTQSEKQSMHDNGNESSQAATAALAAEELADEYEQGTAAPIVGESNYEIPHYEWISPDDAGDIGGPGLELKQKAAVR